ncbi:hypothetical protein ABK040_000154 [Willaertia magna]
MNNDSKSTENLFEYLNQIEKQQNKINNTLIYFSNYLDNFTTDTQSKKSNKQSSEQEIDNQLFQQLKSAFGIKNKTDNIPIKPSTIFSTIPDISRINRFLQTYKDNALSRKNPFALTFLTEQQQVIEHNEELIKGQNDKEILKKALKRLSKFKRKGNLQYDYFESNILSSPLLYKPNSPLEGEQYEIHRLIITLNLFTPYELEFHNNTSLKCLQVILNGHAKIMRKDTAYLPLIYELEKDIELSGLKDCLLRKNLVPTPPPDDLFSFSKRPIEKGIRDISMNQVEWLCNKYLSNMYRYKIEWKNSLNDRGKLIYTLLQYFTKLADISKYTSEKMTNNAQKKWSNCILTQYPILIKRNSQYMLIYGIRWKTSNRDNLLNNFKKRGLYGTETNIEHFNNFPYFLKDTGKECITTIPLNEQNNDDNLQMILKRKIEQRNVLNERYRFPIYPPLRNWIFEAIIPQNNLSFEEFQGVMEGRSSILELLVKIHPTSLLSELNDLKLNSLLTTLLKPLNPYNSDSSSNEKQISIEHMKYNIKNEFRDIGVNSLSFIISPLYFNDKNGIHFERNNYEMFINYNSYINKIKSEFGTIFNEMSQFENYTDLELFQLCEFLQELKYEQLSSIISYPLYNIYHNNVNIDIVTLLLEEKQFHNLLYNPFFYKLPFKELTMNNNGQPNTLLFYLPFAIEAIRENIKILRRNNFYFKLYLRGIYIPENPILHRDYIKHKVKQFLRHIKAISTNENKDELNKRFNSVEKENITFLYENITLLSRFMNLKWKRPLSYLRVMTPTTSEVLYKFVKTYYSPLLHLFDINKGLLDSATTNMSIPHLNDFINLDDQVHQQLHKIIFDSIENYKNQPNRQIAPIPGIAKSLIPFYKDKKFDSQPFFRKIQIVLLFITEYLFTIEIEVQNKKTLADLKLSATLQTIVVGFLASPPTDNIISLPTLYNRIIRTYLRWRISNSLNTKQTHNDNNLIIEYRPINNRFRNIWRHYSKNLGEILQMIRESLSNTEAFKIVHPTSLLIHPLEKKNNFIWFNPLEEEFDLISLFNIKSYTTSFFPIKINKEEEQEWKYINNEINSNIEKVLKSQIGSYKIIPPLLSIFPKSTSNTFISPREHIPHQELLELIDTELKTNRTNIMEMFLNVIDYCELPSYLLLNDSLNFIDITRPLENSNKINFFGLHSPNSKRNEKRYHKRFGFIHPFISGETNLNNILDSCPEIEKTEKSTNDTWDKILKMKLFTKRILRILNRFSTTKDILNRIETNINITSNESKQEIEQHITNIISNTNQLIESKNSFITKISTFIKANLSNWGNDKNKYFTLQSNLQTLLEMIGTYEKSRIISFEATQKVTSNTELDLLQPSSKSNTPDKQYRDTLKNNELLSLIPFLENDITMNRASLIIQNEQNELDFLYLKKKDKQKIEVPKEQVQSYLSIYISKQLQIRNSLTIPSTDYSYILSYGKAKLLNNVYDDKYHSHFITEAEANYLNEKPVFYKGKEEEYEKLTQPSDFCEDELTVDKVKELYESGINTFTEFGGIAGGECELLLVSPNDFNTLNSLSSNDSSAKRELINSKLEYFGQNKTGWMNIDDIAGGGINTHEPFNCVTENRDVIWVVSDNEKCCFEYYPGKSLEHNKNMRKEKLRQMENRKYITHPKLDMNSAGKHHVRETIPLFNLEFLILSNIPLPNTEFPYITSNK